MVLGDKKSNTLFIACIVIICAFGLFSVGKNTYIVIRFTPEVTYLTAEEVQINGITDGATITQLIEKLGQPNAIRSEESFHFNAQVTVYDYGKVEYIFLAESAELLSIEVYGKTTDTPRNIQIGDSFRKTLAKFPREQNYRDSTGGAFYGTITPAGTNVGYVIHNEYVHVIQITPEIPEYTLMIYFEKNAVSRITALFYTI